MRSNCDAARHVATKAIHAAFMVVSVEGEGIFAKTAKTPPLQSALRGGVARYPAPTIILRPRRHQRGHHRRITTRHAASLRPSGNGRIRLKPPHS